MPNLTPEEKAVFLSATNRRKANGVRLRRWTVMAEESQIEALNELWSAWIDRFGKITAIDHLIVLWSRSEARLRDADEQKEKKNANRNLLAQK